MNRPDDWEKLVRENNRPGSPNVILTLEEALQRVEETPDDFDTCFVVLHKKENREKDFDLSWHNAGLQYSDLLAIFQYLNYHLCREMAGHPR